MATKVTGDILRSTLDVEDLLRQEAVATSCLSREETILAVG